MKRGDVVKRVDIDHIREIERESNRLLNEKKWAEAEMVLRKALEVTPMLVPAINNLAFCLFMQDNPEEALEVLRPNLSADIPNPFASALASQICVALGRMDEAEKHLETAVRSFDAGLPQMRLAPTAISNPWYEYTVMLKRAAGDLGRHQQVIDMYRRHEAYHTTPEDRYLAGVASFNLGRMGRAISYWSKLPWQLGLDFAKVAQSVETGMIPPFSLEYRVPFFDGNTPDMASGIGHMMLSHALLEGGLDNEDRSTAYSMLDLAVKEDRDWGLQLAENILQYPAVSDKVKSAALSILVNHGVCNEGQAVDVVGQDGEPITISLKKITMTCNIAEDEREIIREAARLVENDGFDEAIAILEEAITNSQEISLYMLLAQAATYTYKGDLDKAYEILSMLRDAAPDDPLVLFRLAEYYCESGNAQEALRCLDHIELEDVSPTLQRGIANIRESLYE